MKSYIMLAIFILLSSSLSRACGASFFKPELGEEQPCEEDNKSKQIICTACGAALMLGRQITKIPANTDTSQKDSQTSKK